MRLAAPERILPGGMLYTTDILCNPETVVRLGEIIMMRLAELAPDCIMTVETSGIPLALQSVLFPVGNSTFSACSSGS